MNSLKQNFIEQCEDATEYDIEDMALDACRKGDLSELEYLFCDENTQKKWEPYSVFMQSRLLKIACSLGHLDILKFLLTSDKLQYNFNIHLEYDEPLQRAAENNQLEVVKYLLTSPELTDHAHIHVDNFIVYQWAVLSDADDVTIFLLSSENPYIIDFQKTPINVAYVMHMGKDKLLHAMMLNLYRNNPYEYWNCLSSVEAYNLDLFHMIQSDIAMENAHAMDASSHYEHELTF